MLRCGERGRVALGRAAAGCAVDVVTGAGHVVAEAAGATRLRRDELGAAVEEWVARTPWTTEAEGPQRDAGSGEAPSSVAGLISVAAVATRLGEAADGLGESGAPSLSAAFTEVTDPARVQMIEHRSASRGRIDTLEAEVASLATQRDQVASEADPGPAPPTWRTEREPGRPGAPLWRCCDWACWIWRLSPPEKLESLVYPPVTLKEKA